MGKYYYKYKKKKNPKIGEIIIAIIGLFFIGNIGFNNSQSLNPVMGFLSIIFLYYILKFIFIIVKFIFQNYKYFLLPIKYLLILIRYFFSKIIRYKERFYLPTKVLQIREIIEGFKPLRNYDKEEPYQIELSGYLKNFFPNLDIEVSRNYTRPDIIIDNIAIEIKGPTNFNDLKTIPDKIIRYTKEWDYLIIVLFNLKLHENKDISDDIYNSWKKDIDDNFTSKSEKILFIIIN